jgi:hypothetical protein
MHHTPCSPNGKTRHKKKNDTEHAAHALQPQQQDTPQEEENRICNTRDSKTCHKKKETEHAAHAL